MLLALAVVCTAFGFTVQPLAQKALSLETTSIICAFNPLTAASLGWLFLGDDLGNLGLLGAVLILSGIILPNITWPNFSHPKKLFLLYDESTSHISPPTHR